MKQNNFIVCVALSAGMSNEAFGDFTCGKAETSSLLPCQFPMKMETVEQ